MSKKNSWVQGQYVPKNPSKYIGDVTKIKIRSSYELKMFRYCDLSENVIHWSSEEVVVPYKNPVTGSTHRYYVDIYMKHRTRSGEIREKLIEIKPEKQTRPPKTQTRKTKRYLKEVETYVVNKAKWKAAEKMARKNNMTFHVFTERELGIN
jgi:hypothetical protein